MMNKMRESLDGVWQGAFNALDMLTDKELMGVILCSAGVIFILSSYILWGVIR